MSKREVIIALDFSTRKQILEILTKIDSPAFVKVGMELFFNEGPDIIRLIKEMNHKVFIDLKVHDIPNTAAGSLRALKSLGADIVNVHCAGGIKMMEAAKEVFKDTDTLVIGVTQLTSTSQQTLENEILIKEDMNDVILQYAINAKKAGLDGIVCSPLEAQMIHDKLGHDFKTICPGIRYESGKDDQVRVTTPALAKEYTCDYIVVGRPITQAEDPAMMYNKIKKEFEG